MVREGVMDSLVLVTVVWGSVRGMAVGTEAREEITEEEITEDETEIEILEIEEVRVTTTADLTHQPPSLGVVEEGAGGTILTTVLVVGTGTTVSMIDEDTIETEENTFI